MPPKSKSSKPQKTLEEKVEAAMADARAVGLPEGWTVTFNSQDRRRWVSPAGVTFTSLPQAMKQVRLDAGFPMLLPERKAAAAASSAISSAASSSKKGTGTSTDAGASTGTGKKKKATTTVGGGQSKKKRQASSQATKVSGGDSSKSASKQPAKKKSRSKSPQPSDGAKGKSKAKAKSGKGSKGKQAKAAKTDPKYPPTPKIEEVVRPEPESDPETALDIVPVMRVEEKKKKKSGKKSVSPVPVTAQSSKAVTVHWDPNSPEGKRVGRRIRIFDQDEGDDGEWREGRVLRYDPASSKHKIQYEDDIGDECCWLRLKHEIVQCGDDLVWCLVKGFAWWPAQILICEPATEMTTKEGCVYVKFFGADQVAFVKNVPEYVRPFNNGQIDSFIAKNKKKRNPKAIKEAKLEHQRTIEVRNEAIRFYARKAFDFANNEAGGYLGLQVQFYNSFINYPAGDTVVGTVKQYSPTNKKWLILYDSQTVDKHKIDPASWFNFTQKECSHKILDTKKGPKQDPSDEDLAPYLYGYYCGEEEGGEGTKCCSGCSKELSGVPTELKCSRCSHVFHSACCDPPLSLKAVENILNDHENPWICDKCTPCDGCLNYDIVYGTRKCPIPPALFNDGSKSSIHLCAQCIPLYECDRYCVDCGHVWDDFKYQKVQRVLRWQNKLKEDAEAEKEMKKNAKKRKRDDVDGDSDVEMSEAKDKDAASKKDEEDTSSPANNDAAGKSAADDEDEEEVIDRTAIEPSWYHPDSTVWGYNEGAMLVCDSCNLWVHAGCAGLTKEEYELSNKGQHPIYSKEFLCRKCCIERCQAIISALDKEDQLGLFAIPVTEQVAPTYHDVIKNPMDLQTMMIRARKGEYHNYAWVRENFELMVMNALIFNRPTSAFWKESKRFLEASMSKIFSDKGIGKAAPPGKYAGGLLEASERAKKWRQAEKERIQKDANAEKKDLVAGAEGVAVKLAPLRKPDDVASCIPFVDVRLKPVDAYFCSWMESCLSCGSSGAADTMLFCVDCGEAYHSFCANAPIFSMSASAVANWRCPNCKVCEITGEVPADETMLLYCEMCDRACTLTELDPPLSKVPEGLFICGLCVDCTCDNCPNSFSEKKDVKNVKHWSSDPEKCFGCGGCKTVMDKKAREKKCTVCSKYWRKEDKDLVVCKTCDRSVHGRCDRNAQESLDDDRESSSSYQCPECSLKQHNRLRAGSLQMHFENKARAMLQEGCELIPNPEIQAATSDVHTKLVNETEWAVRDMWRREYVSIVKDAVRALKSAEKKFGSRLEGLYVASDQNPEVPEWMIARGRRWVRYCREHDDNVEMVDETTEIRALVLKAKMASAFLALALKCMSSATIKYPERMKFLLVPPDEASGALSLAPDPLKATSSQIIRTNDLTPSQYRSLPPSPVGEESSSESFPPGNNPQSDNENVENNISPSRPESEPSSMIVAHQKSSDPLCCPASPLIGWTGQEHHAPGRPTWRDPRTCAFCHTCGDDDGGFQVQDEEPPTAQLSVENSAASAPPGDKDDELSPETEVPGVTTASRDNNATKSDTNQSGNVTTDPSPSPSPEVIIPPEEAIKTISAGRLIPLSGSAWAHASCALWSSEVYENPGDALVCDVEKARSRGNKLKCFGCGRPGATVGCQKTNCPYNYHFVCAVACGITFTTSGQVLCKEHKGKAKGEVDRNLSVEHMKSLKVNTQQDWRSKGPEAIDLSLCYRLGGLVVHSLGTIEEEVDGFHSEKYIMPPGYTATRIYWSYQAPRTRTVYVLKVDREGTKAIFSIIAADDPSTAIRSRSMDDAYDMLMSRVRKQNPMAELNEWTELPRARGENNKAYALNAPQFFGFGLDEVRKCLEVSPGIAAVTVPLTPTSPIYQFCFVHPKKSAIQDLARRRAAAAAEKALENSSGSARTEGMTAVAKSGGSGRITRALVRRADEDGGGGRAGTSKDRGGRDPTEAKAETAVQEKYKEMKSVPLEDRLVAKRSHIHGWGLFTKKDIKKHQMIIEYMGELLRFRVADKREKSYEESGVGSCYMFRLDLERIVDATMVGCMARFMNHSCQNNAYAKVITVNTEERQEKKIVVFANRDIKKDEEITYDYKFPVEDGSLKCTCGAPNCIGRMN